MELNREGAMRAVVCIRYGPPEVLQLRDLPKPMPRERLRLPQKAILGPKPSNVTYEEAAAIPYGGLLALFFLKKADIQSRKSVLVYGASRAIGTSAIQLAKYFGAEVTGVCSTANLDLVKSLGADAVIDYTQEDFTKNGTPLRPHLQRRRKEKSHSAGSGITDSKRTTHHCR
jgi:NADPH:quinone reductase-like Zn-dependent oxidoreductase